MNMINLFDILSPVYERLHLGAEKTFKKIYIIGDFKQSDVVVDIGGGTGRIAKFFAGRVKSITVVDSSKKMIKQCQKHSGLSCLPGEGEKLPFADNSVDKVILVDAFHHIKGRMKTIKEIARVLKKGGLIIIEEFNPATFGGKLIKVAESVVGFESVFYRSLELEKLFMDKGFDVKIIDNGKTSYYIKAQKL